MAQNSKIEWTTHTTNLWWGCTKVHEGCDNCYAEYFSDVRYKNNLWGEGVPRKKIKKSFSDLAKFQAIAADEKTNHRVFVGSMMDIFEKPKPLVDHKGNILGITTDDLRQELFENISKGFYPNLTFLFLTKRPSNINKYIPEQWRKFAPENVWFGASVVNEKSMKDVIRHIDKIEGANHKNIFWSVEPLLEGISLDILKDGKHRPPDWIIVGGESGSNRRPFDVRWGEKLKLDCEYFGIPFFFKQIDKVKPVSAHLMIRELPQF